MTRKGIIRKNVSHSNHGQRTPSGWARGKTRGAHWGPPHRSSTAVGLASQSLRPHCPLPPYKTENLPKAPQTTTTGFGKHHVTWQVSEVGQANRPLNPHSLGCEERRVVPAFSHKQGKHFPIPSQSETESKPAPRFQANFLLEL